MFTSYDEALQWIHSRLKLGMKPGLKRMEWMMERMQHPERKLRAIHVAGTNGKGSTVSYIRSILQEAGYKVGTFTSPYIEQFNERISINGNPISDQDMVELASKIKPLVEELEQTELGSPTEFEVITAMSLLYFGHVQPVDFVIYEVGLGGRLDSTNIIYPLISVITTIGFDHTDILGHTIEQITYEKAGIIKPGIPVITGVSQPQAIQVIQNIATEKKAKSYILGSEFHVTKHEPTETGEAFTYESERISLKNLLINMKGTHQVLNAALAVKTVEYLHTYLSVQVEEDHIRKGLANMNWVGRFELINDHPQIIIDGAHNPEGIQELVKTVKTHLKNQDITIIFSALSDKKLENMIEPLERICQKIIFTSFDFPRAASAQQLYQLFPLAKAVVYQDFKEAINNVIVKMKETDTLLITGSLYFISEVRRYIFSIYSEK